jgi:hypothetical protein
VIRDSACRVDDTRLSGAVARVAVLLRETVGGDEVDELPAVVARPGDRAEGFAALPEGELPSVLGSEPDAVNNGAMRLAG